MSCWHQAAYVQVHPADELDPSKLGRVTGDPLSESSVIMTIASFLASCPFRRGTRATFSGGFVLLDLSGGLCACLLQLHAARIDLGYHQS